MIGDLSNLLTLLYLFLFHHPWSLKSLFTTQLIVFVGHCEFELGPHLQLWLVFSPRFLAFDLFWCLAGLQAQYSTEVGTTREYVRNFENFVVFLCVCFFTAVSGCCLLVVWRLFAFVALYLTFTFHLLQRHCRFLLRGGDGADGGGAWWLLCFCFQTAFRPQNNCSHFRLHISNVVRQESTKKKKAAYFDMGFAWDLDVGVSVFFFHGSRCLLRFVNDFLMLVFTRVVGQRLYCNYFRFICRESKEIGANNVFFVAQLLLHIATNRKLALILINLLWFYGGWWIGWSLSCWRTPSLSVVVLTSLGQLEVFI